MIKIGFIGTGNMAMAIYTGLQTARTPIRFMAYDLHQNHYEELTESGVITCQDAADVTRRCDFVVLAVKPQNYPKMLADIKQAENPSCVFISIAAGIDEAYIREALGGPVKVVLAMPNTPLQIGKGVTVLSAGSQVTEQELEFVRSIFGLGGEAAVVPIEQMNAYIPIHSSAPAFIYHFSNGFFAYAKAVGLDPDLSVRFFCSTLKGAADMMLELGKTPQDLIEQVSSPGGATLAGLGVLEEKALTETILEACEKCVKRAAELKEEK